MSIRKLNKDEKLSNSTSIVNSTATAVFKVRRSESSDEAFVLTCKLDFSTCSQDEILALATRTAIIDIQRQWRVAHVTEKGDPKSNEFATVNVKSQVVDSQRKTADPLAKAKSLLDKLSPTERAALLASLKAA